MYAAAVLSQVLSLWYLRVQRAKAFDPHRPLNTRCRAYQRWLGYCQALMYNCVNEQHDSIVFQQEWELPFAPEARSGDYI